MTFQEKFSKKVLCIETGKIFKSAREASINIGLNKDAVSSAIINSCKANNKTWKYL